MKDVYYMSNAQRVATMAIVAEMNIGSEKFNMEDFLEKDSYFVDESEEAIKEYYLSRKKKEEKISKIKKLLEPKIKKAKSLKEKVIAMIYR